MPRQVRIEFAGAMYHVMARGDRREPIVQDDEDRSTFLRTLGEACERSGFRVHAYEKEKGVSHDFLTASERAGFPVHAYVLMSNHYHLLLETKESNLSRGRKREK